MKNPIFPIVVASLVLWGGTQYLQAGAVSGIDDGADGCGSGSGGGDPSHGAAPGGQDPVSGALPMAAASTGGVTATCGAVCGNHNSSNNGNSGDTGGGGTACCSGGGAPGAGGPPAQLGGGFGSGQPISESGMPVWEVSEPYINLWLYDEPLGYQPGIGPRVSFGLAYKQRGAPLVSPSIFSLGTNWTCAWLSYVETDGSGGQVSLVLKRGGRIIYSSADGSSLEYYTHTTLQVLTNDLGQTNGFLRAFPSGAKDYYQAIPQYVRLPDGNTPVFLAARTDPAGRTNILFAYTEQLFGSLWVVQLTSVTDADGRASTLSYTNSDHSLITGATDPFGRTAVLRYDSTGLLTNITDTAGLSSSFQYDSQYWVTNLSTPYGTTTFEHLDNGFTNSDGGGPYLGVIRAIRVVDAVGGTNVYMLRQPTPIVGYYYFPSPYVPGAWWDSYFDFDYLEWRDSFHWGPRQAASLPSDMNSFGDSDYINARVRHWLHATTNCDDDYLSQTLSVEVQPSPDGVNPGQFTWYIYDGMNCAWHEGTNSLPAVVTRALPDSTVWYTTYQRDAWGRATNITDTYSAYYGDLPLTRTRQYVYDGPDLVTVIGPQGETLAGYAYTNHLVLRATNAVGDVTFYTYDAQDRLTSVQTPAGLTRMNIYFPSGPYTNFVQTAIDLEIGRTNSFTYTNDLVYTHTDERGLTTTMLYDNLNRLTNSANSLGSIAYGYDKLDLVSVVDRLGYTTSFGYDPVRRRTAETNALGFFTLYNYCSCGALNYIQDAAGNYTSFTYDNAGRLLTTVYPDNYAVTNQYDLLGELINREDSAGVSVTNWFNNQGQLYEVQDAAGLRSTNAFDVEDRVTNSLDANGVSIAMTYDDLGRLLTRTYPDGGTEGFGYAPQGLVAYTNQLGFATYYGYDEAQRKTSETNANSEVTRFRYNAAGDLLTLTDGKNQTTTWNYDQFGRVTNKLDQTSAEILSYAYDADNRLTNRWSAAKGNTGYAYDPVGNLTNIAYPSSGTVKFAYDAMNRLTNMVDRWFTTRYTYDAAGQLLTEGGAFTSDTVANTYSNRQRVALSLQQPTDAWTNGFGWDLAGRLTNVTSPAGVFAYTYTALDSGFSGRLVQQLSLPGGAYITNFYDPVARLFSTVLDDSGGGTLDGAFYGYNAGNQRTAYTNASETSDAYNYDPSGQLTRVNSETDADDRIYSYDAAWNLSMREVGGGMEEYFYADIKNELTNGTSLGPLSYDANGNLTSQTNLNLTYVYDDENRLYEILCFVPDPGGSSPGREGPLHGVAPGTGWGTVFYYDGLGRLRQRADCTYDSTGFDPTNFVAYIYDGWRVIQERNVYGANLPTVSYTRGLDLSGSLQGAGGIGGLLARSSGYSSGNWTSHAYYHADGNGNITCLVDTNQTVVACYRYDPFGNTISQSGTLADANTYRFSSKEIHTNSLMYYYGYRFYDPSLQRWINRDPLGDFGSTAFDSMSKQVSGRIYMRRRREPNAFLFVLNNPIHSVDALGLQSWIGPGYGAFGPGGVNGSSGNGSGCPCGNGGKWMSVADLDFGGDFNKCVDAMWNSTPPQSLPGGLQVIGIGIGIAVPPIGLGLGLGSIVQYAMATLYCESMQCVGSHGGAGGSW